jgi:hypothetical protein
VAANVANLGYDDDNALFLAAVDALEPGERPAVSDLARRLGISSARAADLIQELEEIGYLAPREQDAVPPDVRSVPSAGPVSVGVYICSACEAHGRPYGKARFEVATVPGAISTHWCGMKVRWTGRAPRYMDPLADPDDARGVAVIALLVGPALLALLLAGPLAAVVTLPLTYLALQILKATFQGFQWWGDFFDHFSRRR